VGKLAQILQFPALCTSSPQFSSNVDLPDVDSRAMEVALTFGSLGDIIAIWQLAIKLRRVLGHGCDAIGSSSKEYQELRRDLDLFVQVLLQVNQTPAFSPCYCC
jgi:hypothetical protein